MYFQTTRRQVYSNKVICQKNKMCYVIIFLQMAKHVGLIPSLDGGLYQVSGDKVEVNMIKSNSNQVLSSSTFEMVIW